jgi:hypothetical protein
VSSPLVDVDSLNGIIELEETQCPFANLTEFTASIAMDIAGDVDAVSDESLAVIRQGSLTVGIR